MRHRVHDPITVTVDTTQQFLPDALSALAAWGHELVDAPDPDRIRVPGAGHQHQRAAGPPGRDWAPACGWSAPTRSATRCATRLLAVGGVR